jgi:glycosyltransferase involved in cell wall biosynthesis
VTADRPLVALDADVLGRQRTGDEAYVLNLLRELPGVDPELAFAAMTRHPRLVPPGVQAVEVAARSQVDRLVWSEPRALRAMRPAIAHFQYVVPAGWRGPSVVTVHDLYFTRHPREAGLKDRIFMGGLVPRSIARSRVVLTVSEFSRRDLVDRYGVDPDKVVVTHNGLDPAFGVDGDAWPAARPYLLLVGALQPRKGPVTALEALARLDDDLRLLMVGPNKRGVSEVHEAIDRLGVASRVEMLGHVEQHQLASLYRGAAAFVFPSVYEGFGLPVLEAMASGTPVVTTTAGALPEVAGDAAVLVPPRDPAALAEGIREALRRRDELVAAGLRRAACFTWERCARETAAAYREALGR